MVLLLGVSLLRMEHFCGLSTQVGGQAANELCLDRVEWIHQFDFDC